MNLSQADDEDPKLFVKVFFDNNIIYFPISKSAPVLEIKRNLIPYTNRKIRDMKIYVKEMGEVFELKKCVESGQNLYLILRNQQTETFDKLTDLPNS